MQSNYYYFFIYAMELLIWFSMTNELIMKFIIYLILFYMLQIILNVD